MIAPPRLRPGDAVSIVAPSGPFDRATFERGLAVVSSMGFTPRFDDRIFSRWRYLAGPDEARRALWEEAVADPETTALWCARGGYGATRLLGSLSLRTLVSRPKLLVGFSDVTALHAAVNARGLRSLHGPVVTQLSGQPPEVLDRLRRALLSAQPPAPLAALPARRLVPGTATGLLFGGNLAVFSRLAGTPYLPSLSGAVLLLEDVGERPYRIDRMWTHLRAAGAFDGLRGVAVGDLVRCEEPEGDYSALDVVEDLCRELGVPAAAGFPVGHGNVNHPVPLGARVRLDAEAGTLDFLEGAVA